MKNISDEQIIDELQSRFEEKDRLLSEQKHFLTELRSVNEKLLASERQKSLFLSNIKNEVNNPMTAILGLLKQNISGKVSDAKAMQNSRLIYQEASVLNFQLQNIFTAAELEAGESSLELSNFSFKSVLDDAIFNLSDESSTGNVYTLVDPIDDDLLYSDRGKVYLIVSNLLSNAYKFGQGKQVEVTIKSAGEDHLEISILDHGNGISKSNLQKVYDRFSQLETGTTKSYNGHGLGLAVVNPLTELLEGQLAIISEEGKGTEVVITLPKKITNGSQQVFDDEDGQLFMVDDNNEELF